MRNMGAPSVVPVGVTGGVVPVTTESTTVPPVVGVTTEQQNPRNHPSTDADKSPVKYLLFLVGNRFPHAPFNRGYLRRGRPA